MVPLGDVGQVEAPFNLLVDCINLNATLVHVLRRTYQRVRNQFGHHRWYFLGDVGQVETRFCQFGDCVNLNAR
jgi:hypothetical protein